MLPKLLIVVTCLYVANAAVAPSILDDEDTSNLAEVSRTARSCGFASCNSLCRKQGHARGVCIGTYCQCRFQRKRRSWDEGNAVENAVEDRKKPLETNDEKLVVGNDFSKFAYATFIPVSGEGSPQDASNSETDVSIRSCGYTECNNFCRKMGYARGVCIGTYCQCRSRIGPMIPSSDFQRESTIEDVAENGNQATANNDEDSLDAPDHERFVRQARSCGAVECNNHCKKLGHARGVCIGTYCQCRSRLRRSADFLEEDNSIDDNEIPTSVFSVDEDVSSQPRRVKDCNLRWCEQNCRRIGFSGGACVNGRCKCDIMRSANIDDGGDDNIIPANAFLVDDDVFSQLRRAEDCNLRWCEQNCRRIGFPSGACVDGRCKCDILRSAVPVPFANIENEEETQSRAVRRCTLSLCARNCRRLGFRFSYCVNGRCYCLR